MANITQWRDAVEIIKPYVFKIETPRGSGTGFLCAYTENRAICGIATAAHVIIDSHLWEEPIRLEHHSSSKIRLLRYSDRIILLDPDRDTAVIIFRKEDMPLPKRTLLFIKKRKNLKVGVEIGWVGFPAVSPENLCFFTGRNSCWLKKFYLVDGVAINGVSGGPAFYISDKGIKIVGCVSAYLPNRIGSTPGLAMISDVDQYLDVIKKIKNWDAAKKKETSPQGITSTKQDSPIDTTPKKEEA